LEQRLVAQYGKAVGEAAGDEELAAVRVGELHGDVASERGRAAADVDRDVEHPAPHRTHELRLGVVAFLEVKPPHHAAARQRFVVLHEAYRPHQRVEVALRVTLEEIPAHIAEYLGLEDHDALDVGCDRFHDLWARVRSSASFSR
jgi:hypothetical protein